MPIQADGFQGEEGGRARSGSLRWVVDPIDGTANFMRGGKRFCVSLGCLDGDVPVIGVIVAPALEETFAACHGCRRHAERRADPCRRDDGACPRHRRTRLVAAAARARPSWP